MTNEAHPAFTRRDVLRGGSAATAGIALSLGMGMPAAKANQTSGVTIGVISDTHIRDTARLEITDLADQTRRYEAFAHAMNQVVKPDFVVQLGDLNDGVGESAGSIASEDEAVRRIGIARSLIHDRLDAPVYNVVGNHENRDPAWDKARIHRAIDDNWADVSDTWYNFSYRGYEFVFLNTGYTDTATSKHQAPPQEVAWLDRTLARIRRPTFVFMHVPASAGHGVAYDQFTNQDAVKALLAQHRRRGFFVAGFFGHCHHADEWDRMRMQADDYGNTYYHVTAPHQWMGDSSQIPWAVIEITDGSLRFRVGSGVDNPNGYRTEWSQGF